MNDRLQKHLLDAADAAQAVLDFIGDADASRYAADRLLRSAVERQLTVLGEAARRALDEAPDLRLQVPDLVFAVALRNRLVHGYDTVDDAVVYDTARKDLPGMVRALRALLVSAAGSE
jgi:uncharacterized protein with HEPN domain